MLSLPPMRWPWHPFPGHGFPPVSGLSPTMKMIARIADPAVSCFETIVKKTMSLGAKNTGGESAASIDKQSMYELRAAVALARTSRLIGAHEEKIVLSAAQLSQRNVADVMLDIEYVSMIPATDSLSDTLMKAHLDMHSRCPVCEKAGDALAVIGYLNFKDIVNTLKMSPENPSIIGITRPIKKIPAETHFRRLHLK